MPIPYSGPAIVPRTVSSACDAKESYKDSPKEKTTSLMAMKCALSPILNLEQSPWSTPTVDDDQTPETYLAQLAAQFCRSPNPLKNREGCSFESMTTRSGQSTPTWPPTAPKSIATQDPDDKHSQARSEPEVPHDATYVGSQMVQYSLTTVMVRNVHNRICAAEFATRLDALGFKNHYDLCLIPTDPKSGRGKGYGFVNFLTPHVASRFCSIAETLSFEPGKRLEVAVARLQGSELTMQSRTLKEKKNRSGTILFKADNAADTSASTASQITRRR